jgi:hypothetical protein
MNGTARWLEWRFLSLSVDIENFISIDVLLFGPPCAVRVFSGFHAAVFDRFVAVLYLSPGTALRPFAFH